MLNIFKKTEKPVTCEVQRSPNCLKKMTKYNRTKDGKRICEPCTNL